MSAAEFKERVRAATDIVELIGQHVKLRRTGANWQGLCPFHHERSPSFTVNPARQNYYCFGCQRGGDVFSFVMELEGLSFREALEALARRADIPVETWPAETGGRSRQELFTRINDSSAAYYHQALTASPSGRQAREYLRARGVSDESVAAFQLGYAGPSWRQLVEHLSRQDFPPEACEELGLIRRKSSGPGYYDSFRSRILFPVRAVGGRVLGFGARVLDDSLPKYINSADSPVYTKKAILYGLDRAWREIRRRRLALLVEGYFDVISLHQAGLPIAVAACGTAFSTDQARLLKRYTERVCILADGDAAGQRAAVRSAGVLLAAGLRPSLAFTEPGEDPDSLVRKEGPEAFGARLRGALDYFPYLRELVRRRGDRPAQRERAIRRILEDLSPLPEGDLHLETLMEEAAAVFEVDKRVLARELARARRTPGARREPAPKPAEDDLPSARARQEKLLLRALLDEGPARQAVLELLGPEDFAEPVRARIFASLEALGHAPSAAELGDLFPDPASAAVIGEIGLRDWPRDGSGLGAAEAALRLKIQGVKEKIDDFSARVQAAERIGEAVSAEMLAEWKYLGEQYTDMRAQIERFQAKQKGS